ncbi:hypothetical protein GCM10020256_64960 [Streptomyces thermocoprophilus]
MLAAGVRPALPHSLEGSKAPAFERYRPPGCRSVNGRGRREVPDAAGESGGYRMSAAAPGHCGAPGAADTACRFLPPAGLYCPTSP